MGRLKILIGCVSSFEGKTKGNNKRSRLRGVNGSLLRIQTNQMSKLYFKNMPCYKSYHFYLGSLRRGLGNNTKTDTKRKVILKTKTRHIRATDSRRSLEGLSMYRESHALIEF